MNCDIKFDIKQEEVHLPDTEIKTEPQVSGVFFFIWKVQIISTRQKNYWKNSVGTE